VKFGAGSEQRESHRYPNVFHRQRLSDGQERLRIGPGRGHVDLLIELVECLPEPLRLLYVLVAAHGRHRSGRYEAVSEMSFDDAETFLRDFCDFLQSDGRHHLWVASPGHGTVIYDRHDLIYAYGPLDRFVDVLQANGLKEGKVDIPAPHWHGHHPEFDEAQSQVLSRFQWIHSPLRDGDDV
jgi:hypothetical protein